MALNLEKMEERLKEVKLPDTIQLNVAETITNVPNFFKSHIAMLRSPVASERIKKLFEDRLIIASQAVKEYNEQQK